MRLEVEGWQTVKRNLVGSRAKARATAAAAPAIAGLAGRTPKGLTWLNSTSSLSGC